MENSRNPLDRDLLYIIYQFLNEKNFQFIHQMEKETKLFFNQKYFEDLVIAGKWKKVTKYITSFISWEDSPVAKKLLSEVFREYYIDAIYRKNKNEACSILFSYFEPLKKDDPRTYDVLLDFLKYEDIKDHPNLKYDPSIESRTKLMDHFRTFLDKLSLPQMPVFSEGRLRSLINHSLNWQHKLCKSRRKPVVETLLIDHRCPPDEGTPEDKNGALVSPKAMEISPKTKKDIEQSPIESSLSKKRSLPSSEEPKNKKKSKPVPTLQWNLTGTIDRVASTLAFHPKDFSLLLFGTSSPSSIQLWDLSTFSSLNSFNLSGNDPKKVCWSKDGNSAGVIFKNSPCVQLFSTDKKTLISKYFHQDHKKPITDIEFGVKDSKPIFATSAEDGTILVKYVDSLEEITKISSGNTVLSIALCENQDVSFITSVNSKGSINVWTFDSNFPHTTLTCNSTTYSLVGYFNGRLFSCGTGENQLVEWNIEEGKKTSNFLGIPKKIAPNFMSIMANYLAVAADKSLYIWNIDSQDVLQVIESNYGNCEQVSINSNGSAIAWIGEHSSIQLNLTSASSITCTSNRSISPPPLTTSFISPSKSLKILPPFQKEVLKIMYLPSCAGIVALAADATLKLWKWNSKSVTLSEAPIPVLPKSGRTLTNYVAEASQRQSVLVFPCLICTSNSLFILSSYGSKIALWNIERLEELLKMYGPDGEPSGTPTSLALSLTDNNNLAIGLEDKSIRIYSVMLKNQHCKLVGHQSFITSIYFDHQLLISGGFDGQLIVWHLHTKQVETSQKTKKPTKTIAYEEGAQKQIIPLSEKTCIKRLANNLSKNFLLIVQPNCLSIAKLFDVQNTPEIQNNGVKNFQDSSVVDAIWIDDELILCGLNGGIVAFFKWTSFDGFKDLKQVKLSHEVTCIYPSPKQNTQFVVGTSAGDVWLHQIDEDALKS